MAKSNGNGDGPGVGHNSVDRDRLKGLVARIETLEADKAEVAAQIKDIYEGAKSDGFDTKTLRQVIRLRKMTAAKRQAQQDILDVYLNALGMLADTPLGEAAVAAAGLRTS